MEPLPESKAAMRELNRHGPVDLLQSLHRFAALAKSLVPSCVGLSVTVMVQDQPYTVTATSTDVAALDATQYLDSGPCVDAARTQQEITPGDLLDEERWQLFAQACNARGVRSTLSMPLSAGHRCLPGAVNIYASEANAFTGQKDALASAFGVQTEELITNADLSFMTLDYARELPARLERQAVLEQAIGVLTQQRGWAADEAQRRLLAAAAQAQVPMERVAALLIALDTD